MRRLLLVPAVCGPIIAAAWVKGLVWPVAVTFSSLVLGRRPGDNDEADIFG